MNVIKTITDRDIFGSEGLSHAAPRITARAIVKNDAGLYAAMYAEKFDLWTLPGGGVEGEETVLEALRREVLEETGCPCDEIEELGIICENRFRADYTQYSHYYLVTTHHKPDPLALTQDEAANGTGVYWYPLEKVRDLIETPVHTADLRKFLQARDVAVLQYYMGS